MNGPRTALGIEVPVLCFHNDDPTIAIKEALRRGYTFIWVSEFLDALAGRRTLPARPILMTYDDGRALAYTAAHPVVVSYGVKANIFITSDWLTGGNGAVDASLGGVGQTPMTWANLQTMYATGLWEVHNHTKTHTSLPNQTSAQRLSDLAACNAAVVAQLGCPAPRALAYPNGSYNTATISDLRTLGMEAAFDFAAGGKALSVRQNMASEAKYSINRTTVADGTALRAIAQDLFVYWENDITGGRNDSNQLGFWTLPANGVQDAQEAWRIDSRVSVIAQTIETADYFRVRPSDVIYSRFLGSSELQTAGVGKIRIQQYDAALAATTALDLATYNAAAGYALFEADTVLDATARYIKFQMTADATYDGLMHMQNVVLRRAFPG